MNTLDILKQLEERMTPKNWTQGRLLDGAGRYCLVGHIACINGISDHQMSVALPQDLSDKHFDTCRALEKALEVNSLPRVNDRAKSFDELMDRIHEAIEREEAKELVPA